MLCVVKELKKESKNKWMQFMNENAFKFSVLMTIYKKEKAEYFDRALESLENQTVLPTQIVIVKDGPLNESLEDVIKIHAKKFRNVYTVISLKQNHGRGYASKIGIKHISNKWFARMDSDDVSSKNRFELQISAINKYNKAYPKLAVIGGQISEFMDDASDTVGYRRVPQEPDRIKEFAAYRSPINNPTVMINKEALLAIGNYSELNVLEDYDLWVRFLSNGYTLINIPDVIVNMRVGNGMYKRRGGMKYLNTYLRQKRIWKGQGIGTNTTVFLSSIAMMGNILFPSSVRKILYQKILHK